MVEVGLRILMIDKGYTRIEAGEVLFEGKDLTKASKKELCAIRGKKISMIFQEPMTSLNPVFTIGEQLDEVTFVHTPGATKEMAKELIKLGVLDNCDYTPRDIADALGEALGAEVCGVIGKKIILYRYSEKKKNRIELP